MATNKQQKRYSVMIGMNTRHSATDLSFRDAANYVAGVTRKAGEPVSVTVWDGVFEAVIGYKTGRVEVADAEIRRASGGEHPYIAQALRNAIDELPA